MKYKKYISNLINKLVIALILIFMVLIIKKLAPNKTSYIKSAIFSRSINFIKINNLSKKIIGKEVFSTPKDKDSLTVFNDYEGYSKHEKYFGGEMFTVSNNLPVGVIESGVVVYVGNKENYNKTVIVQGVDGYSIWYGNLDNVSVNLYDYVQKGSHIGNSLDDKIYLLIEKDSNTYTYEEYKENRS